MSVPQLEFSPLLDWVEGRLSPQAAQDIELLLAGSDPTTCDTVAWLQAFTRVRRTLTLAAPPPQHIRHQLRERFAAYARARRQPWLLQRIVAGLRVDSAQDLAPAAGTRMAGATQALPRQLIFSCSAVDIALNLHRRPHDDQIDLSGQIFTNSALTPAGWGVLLIGKGGPDATHTDELGEFVFEAVPPGEYTISLEFDQLAITMPVISLER